MSTWPMIFTPALVSWPPPGKTVSGPQKQQILTALTEKNETRMRRTYTVCSDVPYRHDRNVHNDNHESGGQSGSSLVLLQSNHEQEGGDA